jgi:hypothetical protein
MCRCVPLCASSLSPLHACRSDALEQIGKERRPDALAALGRQNCDIDACAPAALSPAPGVAQSDAASLAAGDKDRCVVGVRRVAVIRRTRRPVALEECPRSSAVTGRLDPIGLCSRHPSRADYELERTGRR